MKTFETLIHFESSRTMTCYRYYHSIKCYIVFWESRPILFHFLVYYFNQMNILTQDINFIL